MTITIGVADDLAEFLDGCALRIIEQVGVSGGRGWIAVAEQGADQRQRST